MLSNNVSRKEPEIFPKVTNVAMSDYLTDREIEYTDYVLNKAQNIEWIRPLISKIETNGGIENIANIPFLFEVRYAYEIHLQKIQVQYEYKAGAGESTVDFRCVGKHEWFIELVSILPSKAGKQAIREFNPLGIKLPNGVGVYEQTFTSDGENQKMSEEGEILLAQQKIGEKVFADGQPIKFPVPKNAFHVIVVDMRGMLGIGGADAQDSDDYLEIVYGSKWTEQLGSSSHKWQTPDGEKPIIGLFEASNPLPSAKYIQEHVHFIDFVCERKYEYGEIPKRTVWAANPFLFMHDKIKAREVRITHPLYYSGQSERGQTD